MQAKKCSKMFGRYYALKDVNLDVYSGEVNVLVGENGAGKSTLMKILSGVHSKDEGEILLEGHPVEIDSPVTAGKLGIGTVYQELTLVPELSVAENFFLGTDLITNRLGLVNWKQIYTDSRQQLNDLVGLDIDTHVKTSTLGIAQQQMIEIARVLKRQIKVLILDEPTAVLTANEVDKLFEIIERLKVRNIAIIYISHRLEEIFKIGDHITVLRDGHVVGNCLRSEITPDTLIKMMVGRSIEKQYPCADFSAVARNEMLRVEHFTRGSVVQDISFVAYSGEILGFAGLVGAGRTELMRLIFGADKKDSGQIYIKGKPVAIDNVHSAIRNGIALIPEDRKAQGLVLKRSVVENTTIVALKKLSNLLGLVNTKKEEQMVADYVRKLRIAVKDVHEPVGNLSGGNQQKVVISKWMVASAEVVIFDEPTRGIDVNAKTEVYNLMNEFVLAGKAVIVISSEMLELLGMCNRIIAIRGGKVTGEFENTAICSEDALLKAMMVG